MLSFNKKIFILLFLTVCVIERSVSDYNDDNIESTLKLLARKYTLPYLSKGYNAQSIYNLINFIRNNPEPLNELPLYIYVLEANTPDWVMIPTIHSKDIGSNHYYSRQMLRYDIKIARFIKTE